MSKNPNMSLLFGWGFAALFFTAFMLKCGKDEPKREKEVVDSTSFKAAEKRYLDIINKANDSILHLNSALLKRAENKEIRHTKLKNDIYKVNTYTNVSLLVDSIFIADGQH